MTDQALLARNLKATAVWRVVFLLLAIVVPGGLGLLFTRQANRLEGLADHGRPTTAAITRIFRQGGVDYAEYGYEVDGARYDWSISNADAPYSLGERFLITYLPEDPSLSRPGETYSRARFEAEVNRGFQRRALFAIGAVFVLAALGTHRVHRRLRVGIPWTGAKIAPASMGRALALLFLAIVIGVNFDPKVEAVQVAAFGAEPLGLPTILVVSLVELVLFLPYFWVFPRLMQIVSGSFAKGGSLSKVGIVAAVLRAEPKHRWIVIGGLVYFAVLVGGWIVYANWRGI